MLLLLSFLLGLKQFRNTYKLKADQLPSLYAFSYFTEMKGVVSIDLTSTRRHTLLNSSYSKKIPGLPEISISIPNGEFKTRVFEKLKVLSA